MKTTAEKTAVMQAYEDGKAIELEIIENGDGMMTNEAPDRIWIDEQNWTDHGSLDGYLTPCDTGVSFEYIHKDAACVEVKEEYGVVADDPMGLSVPPPKP